VPSRGVPSHAGSARLGWTVEPEDVAEGVAQLAYRPAGVDGEWATMRRGAQFEQLLARRGHTGDRPVDDGAATEGIFLFVGRVYPELDSVGLEGHEVSFWVLD